MEFPVCTFDLKTGVLCPKCESKITRGELTTLDLDIMRFFVELEKQYAQLAHLHYVRSLRIDDHLFVVFKEKDLSGLPQQLLAQLKKSLSEKFGPTVKLIEEHRDFNMFLQSLVTPARLIAINKVWLPDQTTEIKAVVEDDRVLKTPLQVLSDFIKQLTGVSVSFELQRKGRTSAVRFGRW
ncbi:MAG: hypothetical protein QW614_05290 [Candidatus Caldarchaeum sp.]|uniref:Transcription elongation factor NusA n=1 Tax=Caldiarchaeum subterraneum TaxID=311458 RepID=A0A7C5QQL0_CALS0